MLPESLLAILQCPACRGELQPSPAHDRLRCLGCNRVYPVRDGIPVLLVEEASS